MEGNTATECSRWQSELKLAQKEDKKWLERSKKIVKRYRAERTGWADNIRLYNILWSNIQTMLPALYGRTPRAQVERRWKDKDPVGRTAATILERALQYEIDHYRDFDNTNRSVVLDRLLPGRGVAWVRFETKQVETIEPLDASQETNDQPDASYECTPVDYVYWEDFRCSPARTWDEVTWVSRRVYMSREDGTKRFGDDFKIVPLTHEPIGLDEMRNNGASEGELEQLKKAQVWEIWDKPTLNVMWVAEGYDKLLDKKDDPYGLDDFWPMAKPLFATQTTDTIVPVPDFVLYQDQAKEIDMLTNRIGQLVEAVKVVGVYDANQSGVERMMSEGVNNTLIPVSNWGVFTEKGGLKGVIDFLPLDMVLNALRECYSAREAAKQVIYEVTGLSDIIRGASIASETATAQQIKSQYASLRLKRLQHEVAEFASTILRIKAQLMCDLYSPQALIEMSGIMGTDDRVYAEQAIQLLKTEPARNFRIEVAADSLVEMDEAGEKQSRTEFMQAFGSVVKDALPIVQQAPEMGPLIGEVLTFVVRTFRGGRQLENVLESTIQKMAQPKPQQGPTPQQMQMQMEQAKMQQTQQSEQMRAQADAQRDQSRLQLESQIEQQRTQQTAQLELARQDHEAQIKAKQQAHELQLKQMELASKEQSAMDIAKLDASVKIRVAQIAAQKIAPTTQGLEGDISPQDLPGLLDPLQAVAGMHAEMMQGMGNLMNAMNQPKTVHKQIVRGPDGKAQGLIEITGGQA